MTEKKKKPQQEPQRFQLCDYSRTYDLLGSELFIQFIIEYPKIRLYECLEGPEDTRIYGLSSKPYKELSGRSMITRGNINHIKTVIKTGEV